MELVSNAIINDTVQQWILFEHKKQVLQEQIHAVLEQQQPVFEKITDYMKQYGIQTFCTDKYTFSQVITVKKSKKRKSTEN